MKEDVGYCSVGAQSVGTTLRWYFNKQDSECKGFLFSGCLEPASNNFPDRQQCENACLDLPEYCGTYTVDDEQTSFYQISLKQNVDYEKLLLLNEHVMYPAPGVKILLPCDHKQKTDKYQRNRKKEKKQNSQHSIIFPFVSNNNNNNNQQPNDLSRSSIYEYQRGDNSYFMQSSNGGGSTPTIFSSQFTQSEEKKDYGYTDLSRSSISEQSNSNYGDQYQQDDFPPELIGFDYSRAVAREQSFPSPIDQNGYQTDSSSMIESEGDCSEDPLNWSSDMGYQVLSCTNLARTNPWAFQEQLGRCFKDYVFARNPLQDNDLLEMSATQHSSDMAVSNTISHFGSDGSGVAERVGRTGFPFSLVGENVLFNRFFNASALELIGQWWCSEGHYQNMVACGYSQVGVSVVIGDSGYFATQHFGCSSNDQDCNSC
eukprot:TRINITY_DN11476_c0_g1_i2.p1 TRINITY_DN11476_c0_g1~~TRINITY_DN11476_c0_g1_i2.p1  ORF type:complete len:428 (-),score=60.27 TRINITY_DN11476_c0_g1_i2:494-1777(-)